MLTLLEEVRELIKRLPYEKRGSSGVKGGEEGGSFASKKKGGAVEFLEYRDYIVGDDPRRIDWRLYARKEKLYVKERESEVKITLYIAIDLTGSMNYGVSEENTKLRKAIVASFTLAYKFLKQRNRVNVLLFSGDGRVKRMAINSFSDFYHFLEQADKWRGEGNGIMSNVIQSASQLKGPGLFIFFSDFLEENWTLTGKLCGLLRNLGLLPVMFTVLHPGELDLEFSDRVNLVSMEDNSSIELSPYLFRRIFKKEARIFFDKLKVEVEDRGGIYKEYVINTDLLNVLITLNGLQWSF